MPRARRRSSDLGGLGLDDAALKELLPEIIKLPPLKTLNLGLAGEVDSQSIDLTRHEEKPKKNALHSLPAELIEAQGQLVFLNLRHNQLVALPDAIGGLASLQRLYLGNNQLAALPEAIGGLASLQELSLDSNQLAALPEAIGGLARLQTLSLYDNQLAALPEAIGGLAQLQRLWLANNQLAALPDAIGGLAALESLWLDNNQLAALPRPSAASSRFPAHSPK